MGCDKRVYTLRGWLAFVAFLDFAQALRSWQGHFLGSNSCTGSSNCTEQQISSITTRLLFVYSLENALVLIVCAFCIHHWSMILMTIISLFLKISYYLTESLKFRSAILDFQIIFPVAVHTITLFSLFYAPQLLKAEGSHEQENEELVKMCNGQPFYIPPKKKKI